MNLLVKFFGKGLESFLHSLVADIRVPQIICFPLSGRELGQPVAANYAFHRLGIMTQLSRYRDILQFVIVYKILNQIL